MTEHNRGTVGIPSQGDSAFTPGSAHEERPFGGDPAEPAESAGRTGLPEVQGAPGALSDTPRPEPGVRAGDDPRAETGFAPPDGRYERHPGGDVLLVGAPGGMPGGDASAMEQPGAQDPNRPPRPGFVPHHQDLRQQGPYTEPVGPAGPPPYDPGFGWQGPPPPAPTPFGAAPPPSAHPPLAAMPAPGVPGGPGAPLGPGGGSGGPNWAPVPAPPASSGRRASAGLLIVIATIVALVAGTVGAGIAVMATGEGGSSGVDLGTSDGSGSGTGAKLRPPDSVAGVAQRVLPSVVMIKVTSADGQGGGAGTGFIVKGGYIITNNHVIASVASGAQMEVVFNDKKTSSATVVGRDPSSDIAVVKPETTHSLPPLSLGDSEALAVGDPVIAIGSPLGLQGSVTTGIVSSLNRPVPTQGETPGDGAVLNAIQTDAAINPGNSGGPLVDMDGRVIGINTAIATVGSGGLGGDAQGGNIGVGFAIPSKKAEAVAEQLISTGKARRAVIGIRIDTAFQGTGVKIISGNVDGGPPLTKGGPAEKAGLKPGDVITSIDGKPVEGPADLIAMITSKNPGDKVKVAYQRGGKETTVEVTLGEAG